jgi:hypothetical protein
MKILKKFFPAIAVIFLIAFGFLFYFQQRAINKLSSALAGQSSVAQNAKNGALKVVSEEIKAQQEQQINIMKNGLEDSAKFITGRVVSVSGNNLVVAADLPDFEKMKETAVSSDPAQKFGPALTYEKKYTVTASDDTAYASNGLEKIKAGNTINVIAKELVYQTDKLTAVMIASPFEKPVAPGQ